MTDLLARIERGVLFLDDVRPTWRDDVDIAILDLGSPSFCMIGQTFHGGLGSGWVAGTTELHDWVDAHPDLGLGEPDEDEGWNYAIDFGFERDLWSEDYEDLARVWLYHIARQPIPDALVRLYAPED